MQGILDFLNGKKTYIIAILGAVFNIGQTLGWWTADNAVWSAVNTILGALGLAFLRMGVSKSAPPAQ